MTTRTRSEIWDEVSNGRHVLVRGAVPEAPPEWLVLRLDCAHSSRADNLLLEAIRHIQHTLGNGARHEVPASAPVGAASRLLGEGELVPVEARFVEACNELAAHADRPGALLFAHLERADESSILGLERVLERTRWLALPLVLHLSEWAQRPGLSDLMQRIGGAVVEGDAEAGEGEVPPVSDMAWDWHSLPPQCLRVLRAAAAFGERFEVNPLSTLVGLSPLAVLEVLQQAADHGAPLVDHGEGRFAIPAVSAQNLRAAMLPSLLAAWHEQIAAALVSERGCDGTGSIRSLPASLTVPPMLDVSTGAGPLPGQEPIPTAREQDYASTFEPPESPGAVPAADEGETAAEAPEMSAQPEHTQESISARDLADAAAHLQQAGRPAQAASAYLEAAEQGTREGDPQASVALIEAATALLPRVPLAQRARLRSRSALAEARVHWLGGAQEEGSTLDVALACVTRAREELGSDAPPPQLLADIAMVHAGVAYDMGEQAHLQTALEALAVASRALLRAGDSLRAARLLNDQAALNLRFGDPVRAVHLLNRSREIFSQLASSDLDGVRDELAETDHLLAKMPLHAEIRPGRKTEALEMAMSSARNAEQAFERLGRPREQARVWETMARLQLASDDQDAAAQYLSRAAQQQQQIGDATGLARTTAAYTEVLLSAGRVEDALRSLADSIALNYRKGSRIGLEFNAQALSGIVRALEHGAPELRARALAMQEELQGVTRRWLGARER